MGKLYKTLHNIEVARQNAVRNAKMANLPVNDDMSLLALSDLYRYQNNKEEVLPEETFDEQDYGIWEQPPEWPNLKEILSNEGPIVYKNLEYTPMFAIILDAKLPFNTRFGDNYILLKTSDGQVLLNSEWTNNTELPWDKTKDIKCSDGHIVRWMIIYKKTDVFSQPYGLGSFNMRTQPILEVTYGPYTFSNPGTWSEGSASGNAKYNNNLMIVDALPGCEFTVFDKHFQQCTNLRKFHYPVTPGLSISGSPTAIGYSRFYVTRCLQEFSVPGLKQWGNPDITDGSTDITAQRCLQHINLPDLEETTSYFQKELNQGCTDIPPLLTVNMPKLKRAVYYPIGYLSNTNKQVDIVDNTIETLTKGLLLSYAYNVKSLTMTNLKTISYVGTNVQEFSDCNVRVNLPSLTEIIYRGTANYTFLFTISKNNTPTVANKGSASLFVSLPSLTHIEKPQHLYLVNSYAADATFDLASMEELDLHAFNYSTGSQTYYPFIKVIVPNLKRVHAGSLSGSGTSTSGNSIVKLIHDEKIDFTLDYVTKSTLFNYYNELLIDDKISHFTLTNPTYVHRLGEVLRKARVDKLTCLVNDYINTSTNWLESTMYCDDVTKIYLQDNVELDLQSTSSFDKMIGKLMTEEQFAKLFTNLVTLPEGETRKLILGTNLTKLSEETKAIATSKGWVLE